MASDGLRARIAAELAHHEPVPGVWDCACGARVSDFEQHRADAVLAVVRPDLEKAKQRGDIWKSKAVEMEQDRDRLQAERDRFRAAWMNARNRAQGLAQRYRYERKLCRAADIRASKAIRHQLAVEAERDAALTALQAVREAQSLGEALAAVAKHDGITTEPIVPGGLRSLLEHVGVDVAGRVITVDGVPIDDVDSKPKPAPHSCGNCDGIDPDTCPFNPTRTKE